MTDKDISIVWKYLFFYSDLKKKRSAKLYILGDEGGKLLRTWINVATRTLLANALDRALKPSFIGIVCRQAVATSHFARTIIVTHLVSWRAQKMS